MITKQVSFDLSGLERAALFHYCNYYHNYCHYFDMYVARSRP